MSEKDADVYDAGLSPSSTVARATLSGLDRLPGSEGEEEDVSPQHMIVFLHTS
jgi:hypothetical protein